GSPYDGWAGPLAALPIQKRLVLITAHRRESFGEPFREICSAIRELAETFGADGFHFVYPVHLNPNVWRPVREMLAGLSNLTLTAPLDYLSLVQLMKRCTLVLTGSGGLQAAVPDWHVAGVVA